MLLFRLTPSLHWNVDRRWGASGPTINFTIVSELDEVVSVGENGAHLSLGPAAPKKFKYGSAG